MSYSTGVDDQRVPHHVGHEVRQMGLPCRSGLGRVLTLLLAVVLGAGCQNGGSEEQAVELFTVTLPDEAPLSRAQIDDLLAALEGEPTDEPPSFPLPASVFALESAEPYRDHPEWIRLLATLERVRAAAVSNGWALLVEGWTDSSGSAEFNDGLSAARARVTCDEIVSPEGYPSRLVTAAGRGIGGDDPSNRRVVVRFVRADGAEFTELFQASEECS